MATSESRMALFGKTTTSVSSRPPLVPIRPMTHSTRRSEACSPASLILARTETGLPLITGPEGAGPISTKFTWGHISSTRRFHAARCRASAKSPWLMRPVLVRQRVELLIVLVHHPARIETRGQVHHRIFHAAHPV